MYNQELLDRSLHPSYSGLLENPDLGYELFNYSCGDQLKIQLKLKGDLIVDGRFSGRSCAIANVSADLMIENLIGKSLSEARDLRSALFSKILNPKDPTELDQTTINLSSSSLNLLKEISRMPSRISCAKLPWTFLDKL